MLSLIYRAMLSSPTSVLTTTSATVWCICSALLCYVLLQHCCVCELHPPPSAGVRAITPPTRSDCWLRKCWLYVTT